MGGDIFQRRSLCNALGIRFRNQIHDFREREGRMASTIAQGRHRQWPWNCYRQDLNKSEPYLLGKNLLHKQIGRDYQPL